MSIKVLTISFSLCLSGKKVSYTVDWMTKKSESPQDRPYYRSEVSAPLWHLLGMRVVYKIQVAGKGGDIAPPILGITKEVDLCTNALSMFAIIVLEPLRLACHTWRCPFYLCRTGSNVRVLRLSALKEHRVSTKEAFYLKGPRLGKCWEDGWDWFYRCFKQAN